jgi:hypothetical protein
MFLRWNYVHYAGLISCFRGAQQRSLGLQIKNGLRNLDPLVMLMLAAMVCVFASDLGARVVATANQA